MVVDAVLYLDEDLQKSDIGIKKITGGSVTDSFMVHGAVSYTHLTLPTKRIV